MNICITGSLGLIGSVAAARFLEKGHRVLGIDNNMRRVFFGPEGDTTAQLKVLARYPTYAHKNVDVRDRRRVENIFRNTKFDAIIHAAGQPSHDKAKEIPIIDFEVNALGTLGLLETMRQYCPRAVFIYTSTNKVYGDNPNKIKLRETRTRFKPENAGFGGFNESCAIDSCVHSFMGSSKLAADIYVQEYGKNLGLKTVALRLGCVTGKAHAGVQMHGFLSFLVKSLVQKQAYEIIGYHGKQVRDQIHALDVASAFDQIIKRPAQGEVFNLGGGPKNSASILELIALISKTLNSNPTITYVDTPRTGDHIYYVTDYSKFRAHYPNWHITKNISSIVREMILYEKDRHLRLASR